MLAALRHRGAERHPPEPIVLARGRERTGAHASRPPGEAGRLRFRVLARAADG